MVWFFLTGAFLCGRKCLEEKERICSSKSVPESVRESQKVTLSDGRHEKQRERL